MSERKDEKWLDEQLQRVVDGATPVFDAQAWKQKYTTEYEALLAGGEQPVGWGLPHPTMRILRGPFVKLAIAAAVLATAGVLLVGRFAPTPVQPVPATAPPSAAQMVSMISLSAAFRQGGMEGLDKQCDRALEKLGPRPNRMSMQELLKDLNGKG
ncbi:MAG: hypothetical protein M1376_03490 [Planctomycetes bacterium]|nr:hypothetical protein [Planctomycetota bacterium]